MNGRRPLNEVRKSVEEGKERSIALLRQAISSLEEQFEEISVEDQPIGQADGVDPGSKKSSSFMDTMMPLSMN